MTWPRTLTAEQRAARYDRVAELTRGGWTASAIAKEMGTSVRTVQRARAKTGTSIVLESTPMTDAQIARARALLADGASYPEVAETVGCGVSTLRRRVPGHQWTHREAGRFRALQRKARKAGIVL